MAVWVINDIQKEHLYSSWWFQPIWKSISQNGNLPQVGMKIIKKMKPPPSILVDKKHEIKQSQTLDIWYTPFPPMDLGELE